MTHAIQPVEPFTALAPGAVLQDRYRIVRQLGRGGMGAVYEAVDERLAATVALKETFSVGPRLRRQFAQEAQLLAQLHHSALPRVSDYFTEGKRAFLVMQFISGVDLAEIITRQPGPFPRNQVIAWADQLLDALIYLHTRNRQIIHRDIKPHNLKLTATGQIALLDFGLAKEQVADASVSTSSVSIFGYTRRYSPLEQIQDQGTTPQSDIYALGATLYHLLTGIKPPDALERAAALVHSKPDPLRPANEIHAAVGPEISAILARAMAQDPAGRYRSAAEFRDVLRRVGRNEACALRPSSQSLTISTSDPTINTTIVRRAPAVDPFDAYSILKPEESIWTVPKQSRIPFAIAAILFVVMGAGFGAFYGVGRSVSSDSLINYARTDANKETIPVTATSQRPDNARVKASGGGSTVEPTRKDRSKPRVDLKPNQSQVATQTAPRKANSTGSTRSRRVTSNHAR